jgi:hypothetical protein
LIIDNLFDVFSTYDFSEYDGTGNRGNGILAAKIINSTISNIRIKNCNIYPDMDTGDSTDKLNYHSPLFAGYISGSTIKDCLVDSTCNITRTYNTEVYTGSYGFIAHAFAHTIYNSEIRQCSVKPTIYCYRDVYDMSYDNSSYSKFINYIYGFCETIDSGTTISDCKIFPTITFNMSEYLWAASSSSLNPSIKNSQLSVTVYPFLPSSSEPALSNNIIIEKNISIALYSSYTHENSGTKKTVDYDNGDTYYYGYGSGDFSDMITTDDSRLKTLQSNKITVKRSGTQTDVTNEIKTSSFVNTLNSNTTDDPWKYSSGNYPTLPCER